MLSLEEVHKDNIVFKYRSFDRLTLNGYFPGLQTEGAVAYFFSKVWGKPILSPVLFKQITDRFVKSVEDFAHKNGTVLLHTETGQKPGDIAQPLLQKAARKGQSGIIAIVVHREKARCFSSYHVKGEKKSAFQITRANRVVNHYYFYLRDPDFGNAFVRICSYMPFPMRVWVNEHGWLESQLKKQGIPYKMAENSFLEVGDPGTLQKLADEFGPPQILSFLSTWLSKLPPPITAEEAAQGYKQAFSIYQMEYCHNVVFRDTQVLNRTYEQLLRDHLEFGRPEMLKIFFERKLRKKSAFAPRTRLLRKGDVSCVKIYYKNNHLKQYNKGGRLLRTEVCINNPWDFRVNKGLTNLPYLGTIAHHATQRFLEAQAVSMHTGLDRSAFERIVAPSVTNDGKRCPGLALGRPRAMALLQGLCNVGLFFCAFTNDAFRTAVSVALGVAKETYTPGQATYDLRKLRLKGLIQKVHGKNRHCITSRGHRVAQFVTKLFHRALIPAIAVADTPLPCVSEVAHDAVDKALFDLQSAMDGLLEASAIAA